MASIFFIKENLNGDIKVHVFEDGINKQDMVKKEGAVSSTVATELVFITMAVDAHEGQYGATFVFPGKYTHTETYKDVIMFMERALNELMVNASPKIYKNVPS